MRHRTAAPFFWTILAVLTVTGVARGEGACCFFDGTCAQGISIGVCLFGGGVYQGDGTTCDEACPGAEPVGACCLEDGSCVSRTLGQCNLAHGIYVGDHVLCEDADCEAALAGACCLPDATCIVTNEDPCHEAGGVFLDAGVSCSLCELSFGACCLADGQCVRTVFSNCDAVLGGVWSGGETTCEDGSCGCRTDVNLDAGVDELDLIAVILGWGQCGQPPCAADVNADGVVGIGDLVDVIMAWGPCP